MAASDLSVCKKFKPDKAIAASSEHLYDLVYLPDKPVGHKVTIFAKKVIDKACTEQGILETRVRGQEYRVQKKRTGQGFPQGRWITCFFIAKATNVFADVAHNVVEELNTVDVLNGDGKNATELVGYWQLVNLFHEELDPGKPFIKNAEAAHVLEQKMAEGDKPKVSMDDIMGALKHLTSRFEESQAEINAKLQRVQNVTAEHEMQGLREDMKAGPLPIPFTSPGQAEIYLRRSDEAFDCVRGLMGADPELEHEQLRIARLQQKKTTRGMVKFPAAMVLRCLFTKGALELLARDCKAIHKGSAVTDLLCDRARALMGPSWQATDHYIRERYQKSVKHMFTKVQDDDKKK